MNNHISALVIGKSGTGKSEFILSLIDEEQREMIPASGEGQTTRASTEFFIDFRNNQELKIEIELKNKKKFVADRMRIVESYFKEDDALTDLSSSDEGVFSVFYEDFYREMIRDNAFFNCREFGDIKEQKICELFNTGFPKQFWEKYKEISLLDNKGNESDYRMINEFWSSFEHFWGEVYLLCREEIKHNTQKFVLEPEEISDVEKYLKVCEDGKSYSALVEKIKVCTTGNKTYKNMFEKNRIDSITLIDTFGLDHAEQCSEPELSSRYTKLLREEFPDIKAVFYLRNIAKPGSSSDLEPGIVTLFKVEPSVVPYIIFTFIDEIFDGADVKGYEKKKAYKSIEEEVIPKIKRILVKQGVSSSLISRRTEELLNTRIGYASKYSNNSQKDLIQKENVCNLEKIFSSIRFEKHMGSAYIPINLMELTRVEKVLSVDNLLSNRNLCDYPNSTKGAIRKRIQPEQGRILGFDSSTMDSTLWSDIISADLNKRFTNVIRCYDWKKYIMQSVSEEQCPEIIKSIEELFVKFSKVLYIGVTNNVEMLNINMSYYGNNIIKYLYDDRKKEIDKECYSSVGEYLTDIYSFENISDETKEKIQGVINEAYNAWFINECRIHNARKIAERITEDTTYQEKERIIENYYLDYDAEISSEKKAEFELIISDNIVV